MLGWAAVQIFGKTALLTGATGGLGRTIAQALAQRGAHLVLSSRKQAELEALAAELPGGPHRIAAGDLGEPGGAEAVLDEAGAVEILVANAGLPATGDLPSFGEEQIKRALRVNLEAPMLMANRLLPQMLERGAGHLVFIASLAGKAANPRSSVYNATKFGLRGFALGLQSDLGSSGVGASLVSPGFVRQAGMFADSGAKPPPGLGTASPEQVAEAVAEAIQHNRVEIAVAPLLQRSLAHVGSVAPRIALLAQGTGAGQRAAESVASGQHEKK